MAAPRPIAPTTVEGRGRVWAAGAVLCLAIIAAYATSFRGVFVLDDIKAIVENPTIQDWSRPGLILNPGDVGGATVGGRPLVNLSLAINRSLSGIDPWSYHAVNLAIHLGAALLLFGLGRRTLFLVSRRSLRAGDGTSKSPASRPIRSDETLIAFAIAALWALHPLQTESVTYVIQRAESLCGLFYLGTLYCFVRGVVSPAGGISYPNSASAKESGYNTPAAKNSAIWFTLSTLSCLAGMATKEVMVTAPLLVFLYDRTFIAGSFAAAWKQRGRWHLALAATWLLLALLVVGASNRGGTAGFGTAITSWQYALTQVHAIPHYLRLAFWPHPLVFDYGTPLYGPGEVLGEALVMAALLAATLWALVRRPAAGFLGAAFFLLLAPSSSIVPVATQTIAEHRMYLPLAAVLGLVVDIVHAWFGRPALAGVLGLALVGGGLTAQRNLVYASERTLWEETVVRAPANHRARTNFGISLTIDGQLAEAEAQFREALRLEPKDAAIPANLCNVLGQQGRLAEAAEFGETAVRLDPSSVPGHVNLVFVLEQLGRGEEAIPHYEQALTLAPDTPNVGPRLGVLLTNRGNRAASAGNFADAITHYRRALGVSPDNLPARANLGNALLVSGRTAEAIKEYREVLRRDPGNRRVQENLDRALESSR